MSHASTKSFIQNLFFLSSFKFRDIYNFLLPFLLLFPTRSQFRHVFFFFYIYLDCFICLFSLGIWSCVRLYWIYRVGISRYNSILPVDAHDNLCVYILNLWANTLLKLPNISVLVLRIVVWSHANDTLSLCSYH